jgi:hypothetical protein
VAFARAAARAYDGAVPRRLTLLFLALACGSSASAPPDGAVSGAVPGLTLTVEGTKADFTDVSGTFTGPPFNRLRVSARRGADPMLEEVQVTAAGDTPLHAGAYSCADQSETGIFYSIGDDAFDDEGDCTVSITKAVNGGGQEATGTFTGIVSNGSVKKTLSGTFRVSVMPSN